LQHAEGVAPLAAALERAILAGFQAMALELAERARAAVDREPVFANLGGALEKLLAITRAAPDRTTSSQLGLLLSAACERALWLLEGLDGAHATFSKADVRGVAALRDCVREIDLLPPAVRTSAFEVLARRSVALDAPPAIRGCSLGALWSVQNPSAPADEAAAARAMKAISNQALGDFLSGLFFLARDEFLASSLLDVVDARLGELDQEDFLVALPSLRRAFSFFPPQERLTIAKRLIRANDLNIEADGLLRAPISAETMQRGTRLETIVFRIIEKFHLLGGET
jgi:hypothetical protein